MSVLAGLGEPFHELREFVKDLWFRNSQEREKGELDLIEKRLDLAEKISQLPADARALLPEFEPPDQRTSHQLPRAALPERLDGDGR